MSDRKIEKEREREQRKKESKIAKEQKIKKEKREKARGVQYTDRRSNGFRTTRGKGRAYCASFSAICLAIPVAVSGFKNQQKRRL